MPKVLENPQEKILQTARELLITRGYAEFSIREVAKTCEVSIGTIYNYFPTKQELVIQVVMDYWEGYLFSMDAIDREESDLYKKLERMYLQLESFVDTFRGVWMKVSEDSHQFHPKVKHQSQRDYIERLTKRLELILDRQVTHEGIMLPVGAYEMAHFIIQNFLIMAQMKRITYPTFDQILHKLLQT